MEKQQENTFVQGKILQPLIVFALPVLFTLFLQAMYSAVDLLIVGKFASPADVSAVSTGSQIMMTLTNLVSSFAMGTTILLGQQIGCGERKNGGRTVGTAIATVAAQVVSVVVSLAVIRKKELPFEMHRTDIRLHGKTLRRTAGLGAPIALQDLLVSVSFLIILAIVNAMGVTASAGVGVAEKVCAFIMLISSAFVAQNYGAGCMDRARKALHYGAAVSFVIGVGMFFLAYFYGDLLAGIFSSDAEVIAAAADCLRAYAIDCLFTSIFFCYTGYYNGIGQTRFVMLQGIAGAFGVRVPVSYLISRTANATLFHIGLATPLSSIVQLLLCLGFMVYLKRKNQNKRFSKDVKPERPLPPSALTRSHCSPFGALRHLPPYRGSLSPRGRLFCL